MHPVIEHILARKNKPVPVNDGRHITLVLPGGVMAGVRGAAAAVALSDMGLAHTFDDVFTVSAGFPNASYMLSDQTRYGISLYYEECANPKFINYWRFWKIADIDYLMKTMQKNKPLNISAILKSGTKLYVRLANETTGKNDDYIEVHSVAPGNYFSLMKAAISAPIIYRGDAVVNKTKYYDPGLGDYYLDHFEFAWNAGATDILIINNLPGQELNYLPGWDNICQIDPDPLWKLGRFERRPEVLKWEIVRMGSLVKSVFGDDEPFEL